ncbi:MAG: ABC transporter permease [Dethiobacteria bacterium]
MGILAPMIFASLSVIVGLKAGLFNIGVSGQMLASGFLATSLIGYSELEACIAKPLVILIGIFVGGLLGMMVGFLKYKFNINEVVSTIMLNYIISFITGFFINTYYADSITRTSKIISAASCLTIKNIEVYGCKLNIPIGIFIALAAVFVTRFLLDRTVFGFELKAVGSNRYCAKYAGMNVGRNMVLTMALSGTLAGLAGVTYYLGYYNTIVPKSLANLGYDAIAVALLGNTSPVGSIFASVLITIFQKGSIYMNSIIGVPKEISSLIVGILLLFSACSGYFQYKVHRNYMKKTGKEGSR